MPSTSRPCKYSRSSMGRRTLLISISDSAPEEFLIRVPLTADALRIRGPQDSQPRMDANGSRALPPPAIRLLAHSTPPLPRRQWHRSPPSKSVRVHSCSFAVPRILNREWTRMDANGRRTGTPRALASWRLCVPDVMRPVRVAAPVALLPFPPPPQRINARAQGRRDAAPPRLRVRPFRQVALVTPLLLSSVSLPSSTVDWSLFTVHCSLFTVWGRKTDHGLKGERSRSSHVASTGRGSSSDSATWKSQKRPVPPVVPSGSPRSHRISTSPTS